MENVSLLSAALAAVPVVWLLVAIAVFKLRAHIACLSGLVVAAIIAALAWDMDMRCLGTAALEGVLTALWPICLVIIAALFTYNLNVKTGAMEDIKHMLMNVSTDKRVLVLLIAWGFAGFLEGMAGFGTPVAIPASLLVGIGLNPLAAITGCLLTNAPTTAFGSAGIPSSILSSVSGVDTLVLSGNVAAISLIILLVSPYFLVCICAGGVRALKGSFAVTTIASLSFSIPWFFIAQLLGPELPDVVGAICSMAAIVAYVRIAKPKVDPAYEITADASKEQVRVGLAQGLRAWSPFIFILVFLLLISTLCAPVHDFLAQFTTTAVLYAGEGANQVSFSWIGTPGVAIFAAAIVGCVIQRASARLFFGVLGETCARYWSTVVTICAVLALAKIMGYSGMVTAIATALIACTGPLFPCISPLIGALGGFITGSGTNSNVLFGQLQAQTAAGLGLNVPWITASNVLGAGIGKMVCPQSIAIGASATGQIGIEPQVLRSISGYFLVYCICASAICMIGTLL